MPEAEILTGRIFRALRFPRRFVCPSAVSREREFAFADTFASVLATTYVNDIVKSYPFGAALL
jgi:hypothetical protein